ncbi:MAG: hypothetical protein K6T83_04690 [Alicyclobacillus sp.]|nr:hypothetical protein [Alicyclobacillus sp.]
MIQPVKVKSVTIQPNMVMVPQRIPDLKITDLQTFLADVLDRSAAAAEQYLNKIYSVINLARSGFELRGSLVQPVTLADEHSDSLYKPFSFVHEIAGAIFDEWPEDAVYLKSLVLTLHLVLDDELWRMQIEHARDCGKLADLRPTDHASVSYLVVPHEGFDMGDGEELIPLLLYHGPNYSWYSSDEWDLSDSSPFYTPHIHLPEGPGHELDVALRMSK